MRQFGNEKRERLGNSCSRRFNFERVVKMSGTKDLGVLLRSMKPELGKGEFVFCTVTEKRYSEINAVPISMFR